MDRLCGSELWSAPLFKCLFVPSSIELARTMATRSGDIVDLIGEMTIAGHTPCQIYSQDKFILEEANKHLIRIARETITEAEQVARILDNDSPLSRDVAALNSLRKKTGEFEVVIQSMKDASEAHIVARFFSLSGQNQNVKNLLSHFKDELKSIARDVLNSARDDGTVLSRIIGMCYNQSLCCSGVLYHDQYSIPLEEARPESPYDPDFESEEYCEHVNLLQVDESYSEAGEASRRLYAHLIKRCFEGDGSDNPMSWSSSLLFVIQYAIWRSSKSNCSPADIKICAVDTTKFSRGQFARDMWLVYMYRDVFSSNSDMQNLVRLREGDCDNGEYLSQGIVVH